MPTTPSPPSPGSESSAAVQQPTPGALVLVGAPSLIALVACVVFMCVAATWWPRQPALPDVLLREFHARQVAAELAQQVILIGGLTVARFTLLGLLAAVAIGRSGAGFRERVARSSLCVAVSIALATLVRGFESGGLPGTADLFTPVAACLVGAWIGLRWLRGLRARLWLVPQLVALAVLIIVGGGVLAVSATGEESLPFEPQRFNKDDKRLLMDHIRRSRTRGGRPQQLRLSGPQVDQLLAWGYFLNRPMRKTQTRFRTGIGVGTFSIALPERLTGGRFLNVEAGGFLDVHKGKIDLDIDWIRVGELRLPQGVVAWVESWIEETFCEHPEIKPVIDSIESLQIEADELAIVSVEGEYGEGFVPTLLSLVSRFDANPKLLAATREQIERIVSAAEALPEGRARFEVFLQTAFEHAKSRSGEADPAVENAAAIYALGIVLGDPSVEEYLGRITDADLRRRSGRQLGRVTLRERNDWTQHFCVSAALALLGSEDISNVAGELKEQIDAASGGGFSFADLLADRAGTTFASAATRDEASARTMQDRLTAGVTVGDIFPPAEGLPEGISAAELKSQFGGIGGNGYRKIEREIFQRLDSCAALR